MWQGVHDFGICVNGSDNGVVPNITMFDWKYGITIPLSIEDQRSCHTYKLQWGGHFLGHASN